jgi:hypothetical protein
MLRLQAFRFALMPGGQEQREPGARLVDHAQRCRRLTGWGNGSKTWWLVQAPSVPVEAVA